MTIKFDTTNGFFSGIHNNRIKGTSLEDYGIQKTVQAIIPTLNEENTIGLVIKHTEYYVDEVLIIDGRSHDNTVEILKDNGVRYLIQEGIGKGSALRQAFTEATGDMIIILDADGSMLPNEIPRYLKELSLGADVVKGSRFLPEGGSDDLSPIRRIGNRFFIILVNLLYGLNLTDVCYGYMAFTSDAIKKILPELRSDGFDIEAEIIIKAAKLGLDIHEVPSYELNRAFGKSNLKAFRDGLKILKVIIKGLF